MNLNLAKRAQKRGGGKVKKVFLFIVFNVFMMASSDLDSKDFKDMESKFNDLIPLIEKVIAGRDAINSQVVNTSELVNRGFITFEEIRTLTKLSRDIVGGMPKIIELERMSNDSDRQKLDSIKLRCLWEFFFQVWRARLSFGFV